MIIYSEAPGIMELGIGAGIGSIIGGSTAIYATQMNAIIPCTAFGGVFGALISAIIVDNKLE